MHALARISFVFLLLLLRYSFRLESCGNEEILVLKRVSPVRVWSFVADFENAKHLNPNLINHHVLDDNSTKTKANYRVLYLESLSHWPHLNNTNAAVFYGLGDKNSDNFLLYSNHRTCFALHFLCLKSYSEFKLGWSSSKVDTVYEENIHYQCPWILKILCRREIKFQRSEILRNLADALNNKRYE